MLFKTYQVHFEENQFEKNRIDGWVKLKWDAVPTIFNVPNPPKRVMTTRKSKYKVCKKIKLLN